MVDQKHLQIGVFSSNNLDSYYTENLWIWLGQPPQLNSRYVLNMNQQALVHLGSPVG